MRKYLASIFIILFILPAMAETVLSGTVIDENNEPMVGATITPDKTDDILTEKQLSDLFVTAIQVTVCNPDTSKGEQTVVNVFRDNDKKEKQCFVTKCVSDKYKLIGTRTAYKNTNLTPTAIFLDKNDDHCYYDPNDPDNQTTKERNLCEDITVGTGCEDQVGKTCAATDPNASEAQYQWENDALICKITKCKEGYEPKGKECSAISGPCTSMPEHAVEAQREWDYSQHKEICKITKCKDKYKPSDDGLSCVSTLSAEDAQNQVKELEENSTAMKEKEQSTANKLLGAASIGAMGIGGMQVASALAEQSADADAERDMSAYIATFRCDYGQGMNIKGGESNITLPGANILLPLYNEYTTLAADLKTRKEALGMSPGIESEVILDAATSGLYDNTATGITDGAFTSLSRAMLDENSADATEWAAQKADTSSQLKTGAIVAGAGAAVGIVGNILINEVGDKPKESSDEITAKYDAKRTTNPAEQTTEQKEKESVTDTPTTPTTVNK